ncbi:hypothetical protein KAU11_08775 [Candidatus Babeliales bacterium]|nr:hypothetical protein [Candidatus Babeliales bacterium]
MEEITKVEVSPKIIEKWRKILLPIYKDNPRWTDIADDKVTKIIKKAIIGWRNCPKSFEKRISCLSPYKNKRIRNLRHDAEDLPIVKKKRQDEYLEAIKDETYGDIFAELDGPEKKFIKARERIYKGEFELNRSSDQVLLIKVMIEELIQNRIGRALAGCKDFNNTDMITGLTKAMSESSKRLRETLQSLGITREQRKKVETAPDGNIAQLTLLLEQKMKKLKEIEAADRQEEEYYMSERGSRPPVNTVTDDEVKALLESEDAGADDKRYTSFNKERKVRSEQTRQDDSALPE